MEHGFYEKNKLALTIFSSQNHKDLILDEVRDSKPTVDFVECSFKIMEESIPKLQVKNIVFFMRL